MKTFRLSFVLLILFGFLLVNMPARAQDSSATIQPVAQAAPAFDLQDVLASVILYLGYGLSLAGAVQLAINEVKPLMLDPVKNRKNAPKDAPDNLYLAYLYIFRAALTATGYFYLWGGVQATRAVVPLLPAFVPDAGVAVVTIALVVLGEEVIHPILDRLYILRDAAKLLGQLPETIPTVNVNVAPGESSNESIAQTINAVKASL